MQTYDDFLRLHVLIIERRRVQDGRSWREDLTSGNEILPGSFRSNQEEVQLLQYLAGR